MAEKDPKDQDNVPKSDNEYKVNPTSKTDDTTGTDQENEEPKETDNTNNQDNKEEGADNTSTKQDSTDDDKNEETEPTDQKEETEPTDQKEETEPTDQKEEEEPVTSQPTITQEIATIPVKDHYLTLSIVMTVACCLCLVWCSLIFTIPGIFLAVSAQEQEAKGNMSGSTKRSRGALCCNIIAVLLWLAVVLAIASTILGTQVPFLQKHIHLLNL